MIGGGSRACPTTRTATAWSARCYVIRIFVIDFAFSLRVVVAVHHVWIISVMIGRRLFLLVFVPAADVAFHDAPAVVHVVHCQPHLSVRAAVVVRVFAADLVMHDHREPLLAAGRWGGHTAGRGATCLQIRQSSVLTLQLHLQVSSSIPPRRARVPAVVLVQLLDVQHASDKLLHVLVGHVVVSLRLQVSRVINHMPAVLALAPTDSAESGCGGVPHAQTLPRNI